MGSLQAQQPLEPTLAALRDRLAQQTSFLESHSRELEASLEVPLPPHPHPRSSSHTAGAFNHSKRADLEDLPRCFESNYSELLLSGTSNYFADVPLRRKSPLTISGTHPAYGFPLL
jgi:hypothetical protein